MKSSEKIEQTDQMMLDRDQNLIRRCSKRSVSQILMASMKFNKYRTHSNPKSWKVEI